MVSALAWLLAGALGPAAAEMNANPASAGVEAVRGALAAQAPPWYDPKADALVPVLPRKAWDPDVGWFQRAGKWISARFRWVGSFFRWLGARFRWLAPRGRGLGLGGRSPGDLIVIGLALLALAILLAVLLELWRRYRPADFGNDSERIRAAQLLARVEGLPLGVRPETADPWSEALRLRRAGDEAGALVALFAHQLLTLDRLGTIRLTPGRTGRQYVRAVSDGVLRDALGATLRLFELVYYGHKRPAAEMYDSVWSRAEAFESRCRQGGPA